MGVYVFVIYVLRWPLRLTEVAHTITCATMITPVPLLKVPVAILDSSAAAAKGAVANQLGTAIPALLVPLERQRHHLKTNTKRTRTLDTLSLPESVKY